MTRFRQGEGEYRGCVGHQGRPLPDGFSAGPIAEAHTPEAGKARGCGRLIEEGAGWRSRRGVDVADGGGIQALHGPPRWPISDGWHKSASGRTSDRL